MILEASDFPSYACSSARGHRLHRVRALRLRGLRHGPDRAHAQAHGPPGGPAGAPPAVVTRKYTADISAHHSRSVPLNTLLM